MSLSKTTVLVLTSIIFLVTASQPAAQPSGNIRPAKYWVFFHDKGELSESQIDSALSAIESSATIKNLQKRAIAKPVERLFDYTDLTVNQDYLDSLNVLGIEVKQVTKWLNAASVTSDPNLVGDLPALEFVDSVTPVRIFRREAPVVEAKPKDLLKPEGTHDLDYGPSFGQLSQIKIPQLHDMGLSGNGVLIGVFDTGFDPDHPVFMDLDVAHTWDFINNDSDVKDGFDSQRSHGTSVLSVLAGNAPGTLIGPAYGASFFLAKTEIKNDEIQQEEDNFIAALEWADSLGCRIVSASLGYIDWYSKSDLDGNTALVTIASDLAVKKGITVLVAAGNENDGTETTIITPADGDSVIAVGAVKVDGTIASFSSRGPTADGRIKPDICAGGSLVEIAQYTGGYSVGSGTSYATPLAAGAVALMIEDEPTLTPMQIHEKLRSTADRAFNPDNTFGFGIMDALAALGYTLAGIEDDLLAYPNPFQNIVYIGCNFSEPGDLRISIHTLDGIKVWENSTTIETDTSATFTWDGRNTRGEEVANGLYIVFVEGPGLEATTKIVKVAD